MKIYILRCPLLHQLTMQILVTMQHTVCAAFTLERASFGGFFEVQLNWYVFNIINVGLMPGAWW